MKPKFIHLRTHSAYSLLEGALPIKILTQVALASQMPALAVTDRNNLFGALEFAETAASLGIQPIIGATLKLHADEADSSESDGYVALLAKDEQGYRNLMALISAAHLAVEGTKEPGVSMAALKAHAAGLICLTGGEEGPINGLLNNQKTKEAKSKLSLLNNIFSGNIYVELQRYTGRDAGEIEAALIDFAYDMELPLVATNQAFFASADDYRAHDALICIAAGRYLNEEDRRRLTPDHRLK